MKVRRIASHRYLPWVTGSVAFLILMTLSMILPPQKVAADHVCDHPAPEQLYGRNADCGYFLNNFNGPPITDPGLGLLTGIADPWGNNALEGVGDIDGFVAVLRFHLQGCVPGPGAADSQRRNAAAFIILTMQGAPAGTPADEPCRPGSPYHVDRWEAIVRQYAAAGLVNFTEDAWFDRNTRIQASTLDPAWYPTGFSIAPSIVFHAPGGWPLYSIKRNCANPIGIPGSLTPLGAPFTVRPLAQPPTLAPIDNPTSANFQASVEVDRRVGPVTVTRQYFLRRGGVDQAPFAAPSSTATYDAGVYPFSYVQSPIPGLLPGDLVCQRIIVSPAAGESDPAGNITAISQGSDDDVQCAQFLKRPYSKVFGGDVMAGAGFGDGCTVDTEASLLGFNRGSGPFSGAGTQVAAFALGQILDYASSQVLTPLEPKALSFANSGFGYASGVYGGDLGEGSAVCAPDYFVGATAVQTGNVSIAGKTFLPGESQAIYVEGNAFIEDDILYPTTFATVGDIPSFRLIVRGNVYIKPNVTRISGLIVAMPRPGVASTGRVYTCGDQAWAGNAPVYAPDAGQINTACGNPLVVNGAVVADLLKLNRTRGTLTQAPSPERYNTSYPAGQGPAETFIYSPESWLNGELSGNGDYDTINILPPIL